MPFRWDPKEHWDLFRFVAKWLALAAPVAAAVGSACALFLWALDWATATRWAHPWLLYLLPLAGVAIVWVYDRFGGQSASGNNLIIEQIHEPGGGVPRRMAPLVLLATVATHLFGGSAGREGTAVQMGGSIAGAAGRWLKLDRHDLRILLMCGVAAGFGAVFGTPLAGAIFALEVLAIGRMSYEAVIPCLIAAVAGDQACAAWGIRHTSYSSLPAMLKLHGVSPQPAAVEWALLGKVAIASVAFGLASVLFAELTHGLQRVFQVAVKWRLLRPVIGGAIVIGLAALLGPDYLGLGVTTPDGRGVSIVNSFNTDGATAWSWLWKILFTAVTLSAGFKGGEVTPLFFVGATLGNALGHVLGVPADQFALFPALGFVAVFAGATNTPLACTLMAVELFGPASVLYFAVSCFLSYLFSGHSGIYLSQRIGTAKGARHDLAAGASLRSVRERE